MAQKRDGKPFIVILILLLAFMIYTSKYVSAEIDPEHSYIIFQDDFETSEARDWTINNPPEAPQGSSMRIETDDGNQVLCSRGRARVTGFPRFCS